MTSCFPGKPARHRRKLSAVRRMFLTAGLAAAWWAFDASPALAASESTRNFEVIAESSETARVLASHAEELRSALAEEWLGASLPDWDHPCVVQVTLCPRLSGDTTYTLGHSSAMHWRMVLRGPVERIVETLLPHEVLHTVLASHYQRAVPRWADEGAALSVEAEADQERLWAQEGPQLLRGERFPLADLFASESYPEDRDELRAFYVQGAAVTKFLLQAGKARFLEFVDLGMAEGWENAVVVHYGFDDLESLETAWVAWLQNSRPEIAVDPEQLLSDACRMTSGPVILTAERAPANAAVEVQGGL